MNLFAQPGRRGRISALSRQIIFINFVALAILVTGVLYIQSRRAGLVDERMAGIRMEALTVASALAEYATVDEPLAIDDAKAEPLLRQLMQPTRLRARIYARNGHLVIDTRNRWREAIYARRVPHKVFIAPAMHFLFSERKPPFLGSRPLHLCGRLLELVALAAGHVPPSTGALPAPAEAVKKARRILPEGNIYVGLAPGAGDLTKAWPRYKFEKVALAQAAKGRVPVFILGPQELGWYDELQATVPQAKFPLQEYDLWGEHAITLDHTLAIGALLNAAVANDSGAGHMLAAIDCPLISLFGPTSPDKLAPQVTHGIVLRAQDFGSSQTRAISEQAVNDAIDKLLSIKGSK